MAPNALEWFLSIGSDAKTVEEAVADPVVAKAVQEGVDRANVQAASSAQKIQKWTILNQGRIDSTLTIYAQSSKLVPKYPYSCPVDFFVTMTNFTFYTQIIAKSPNCSDLRAQSDE